MREQPLRARCVSIKHALRPSLDVVFRANNAPDKFTDDILRATFGQVKVGFRRGRKNGGLSKRGGCSFQKSVNYERERIS